MADVEKVKQGIKNCIAGHDCYQDCPYFDDCHDLKKLMFADLAKDALSVIEELQAKIERLQQIWIPVGERLPEEKETIFAKLKGTDKWRSAMFEKMSDDVRVVVVFSDGTRRVSHSHTVDGKWECEKSPVKRTVTHWMPNPELPKDGEGK